jgi:hypothetical protein
MMMTAGCVFAQFSMSIVNGSLVRCSKCKNYISFIAIAIIIIG